VINLVVVKKKEKLSNGKTEGTVTPKGNKEKDNKNKVKEKESVPWKKII